MRRGQERWAAGLTLVLGAANSTFAIGQPPFWIERSPETVIVDLNQGQFSFECTGTARDFDPFDTVYISTAILPTFMTLERTIGNPASFRLHAENLTSAANGGYIIDIIASDSPTSIANSTSVRFAIGVVPEPATLNFGVAVLALIRRGR